jgi:UDP-glucose 4-epimerase
VIDDIRDGNREAVNPDAILYEFDFGNLEELTRVFKSHKIDCVLHLAASANVPDSVINPREYYQNNLASTLNLLNVMYDSNVQNIIFSSTAAVYGEPEYNPIDENHPTSPINPYGWSKLFIEQIIKDYSKAYGLKYIIFRYFCAAGASKTNGESRSYESHLIPVILDTLLHKREKMHVFGRNFNTVDGTGVRDYIHVMDIADAHILALTNMETHHNHVVNLGSNTSYSVLQVISEVEKYLQQKVNYIIDEPRPGDPATLTTTCEKAKKVIGWEPKNDLRDILLSAYHWRKNPLY